MNLKQTMVNSILKSHSKYGALPPPPSGGDSSSGEPEDYFCPTCTTTDPSARWPKRWGNGPTCRQELIASPPRKRGRSTVRSGSRPAPPQPMGNVETTAGPPQTPSSSSGHGAPPAASAVGLSPPEAAPSVAAPSAAAPAAQEIQPWPSDNKHIVTIPVAYGLGHLVKYICPDVFKVVWILTLGGVMGEVQPGVQPGELPVVTNMIKRALPDRAGVQNGWLLQRVDGLNADRIYSKGVLTAPVAVASRLYHLSQRREGQVRRDAFTLTVTISREIQPVGNDPPSTFVFEAVFTSFPLGADFESEDPASFEPLRVTGRTLGLETWYLPTGAVTMDCG